MPILALNSIPHTALATLPLVGLTDIIGILLYVGGLSFEVTADRQKSAWVQAKKNKEHDEDFLTHGLWSKSRHPNYFVSRASFSTSPNINIPLGRKYTLDRNRNHSSRCTRK
jgi:steroid 5-alpha reductase family enzyme